MQVNQDKLRLVLAVSRSLREPKHEPVQLDFETFVEKARAAIVGCFKDGFHISHSNPQARSIAIAAEFVKRTYSIVDVDTEQDREALDWARNADLDGGISNAVRRSTTYSFFKLLSEIKKHAPTEAEYFFALQNIFDETVDYSDGCIARTILICMDSVPGADLDALAQDHLLYRKKMKQNERFADLPALYESGMESAMFRIIVKKAECIMSASKEKREEAVRWLDGMGLLPEEIEDIGSFERYLRLLPPGSGD